MDIKSRVSSAIQPKVTSESTETKSPAQNSAVQAGIAKTKDGFEAAKTSKLFSDNEIDTAKGSRDSYQVVDTEASLEFFIGQSLRLIKGDIKNDIDAMSNRLDELKKSAAEVKAEILQTSVMKH
jgi:hypothetical protein